MNRKTLLALFERMCRENHLEIDESLGDDGSTCVPPVLGCLNHVAYSTIVAHFILKRLYLILCTRVVGITTPFFSEKQTLFKVVLGPAYGEKNDFVATGYS